MEKKLTLCLGFCVHIGKWLPPYSQSIYIRFSGQNYIYNAGSLTGNKWPRMNLLKIPSLAPRISWED